MSLYPNRYSQYKSTLTSQHEILEKAKCSEEEFQKLGLDWITLYQILDDYKSKIDKYKRIGSSIAQDLNSVTKAHSIRFRTKDPISLLAKIIRKTRDDIKHEIDTRRSFSIDNYEELITDLIGIRILHIHKNEWLSIDEFIKNEWHIKEKPIINLRIGEDINIAFNNLTNIDDYDIRQQSEGYRSIHYTIIYPSGKRNYYVEIQTRTLLEEAWSEINHQLRYPVQDPPVIIQTFLHTLNYLCGSADNIISLIFHAQKLISKEKEFQEEISSFKSKFNENDSIINDLIVQVNSISKISEKEKEELIAKINLLQQQDILKEWNNLSYPVWSGKQIEEIFNYSNIYSKLIIHNIDQRVEK